MSSVVYNTKTHLFPASYSAPSKMFKYQNIAPAPVVSALAVAADGKTLPRKYTPRVTNVPYQVDQSHSVQRRNARERNRVKQVNNSFARLRQHIPQTIIADLTKGGGRGPHKKISKVDTLRIAVEYIRRLQDLVDDLNSNCGGGSDTASISSFSSIGDSSSAAGSPAPSQAPQIAPATQLYYNTAPPPTSSLPTFQSVQLQQQFLTQATLSTYCSATSQTQLENIGCHSPTASFNSSMSFDSGTFDAPQQLSPTLQQQSASGCNSNNKNNSNNNNNNTSSSSGNSSTHLDAHLQLKFEPYDSFNLHEEDCAPDDEEILDYISLWQEQ